MLKTKIQNATKETMKYMATVSESSLTPMVTGTSPRFAQCQRKALSVRWARAASSRPSQFTSTVVASASGTPMPSTTANQPAPGLPSFGPNSTSSQKLTMGDKTPKASISSYV